MPNPDNSVKLAGLLPKFDNFPSTPDKGKGLVLMAAGRENVAYAFFEFHKHHTRGKCMRLL
jgi:hypothetical protein